MVRGLGKSKLLDLVSQKEISHVCVLGARNSKPNNVRIFSESSLAPS